MRVTMLVRCLAMMRGGGETRHLAWIRELAALGVEVNIVTGAPWLLGSARHPVDGATTLKTPYLRDAVYRWQRSRGFGRLTSMALHMDEEWFCRAAWQHIASTRPLPDIVHAHALHQAARLRRADVPVIINLPGAPHSRYVDDLRHADVLIGDGWAASALPDQLGRAVENVPKGVDATRFSPHGPDVRAQLGFGDAPVIIAVGRLVPIKNAGLLIEALPAIRAQVPAAKLLLVGEGPEQHRFAERARQLQVADAVVFAGFVPNENLGAYYRSADVFALPSEFDNSPNVVLEAMSAGLPVVATDVGGVAQYVEAGRGGELVPRGDAAALAASLVRWLTSPAARQEARHHNRLVVEEKYSWRASAQALLAIYERVRAHRTRAIA
jgi:glycosyltransferase involved in cell wall biosynthesis